MNRNVWAGLAGLVIAITIGLFFFMRSNNLLIPDRSLLAGKPEFEAAYDKALAFEKKIKENPKELINYSIVGSEWKMIADTMRDSVWYRLSLDAYERGIAITNQKNTLFLTNAGQIAEELGDFQKAKKYYMIAIDVSPGDVSYHLLMIKLVKNKLHGSEKEILDLYNTAMSRVLGGADLVSSRAHYLKSIGRFADAKNDFELLYKNKIITGDQYNDELKEIGQLEATKK